MSYNFIDQLIKRNYGASYPGPTSPAHITSTVSSPLKRDMSEGTEVFNT